MQQENFLQNRLVATKLVVPATPRRLISRQRLTDLLAQGSRRKLTLVCAPAGFGKTTLLASWLQQKTLAFTEAKIELQPATPPANFGWVALDENDNDPKLFWQYLLSALEQAVPGLAAPLLEQLQNRPDAPLQPVLTDLINRVLEYNQPVTLVLDDYHHIVTPQIHTTLSYLLDYLPAQLQLVVVSRAIPPLPLARLRARGQLLELHADLLRCNLAETAEFFSSVMEIKLPQKLIQETFNRTEGWLVGLQLLALSLQGEVAFDKAVAELQGTQRYILDYLTEEVLHPQPPKVQQFLLHTAVLPQFCAALCDFVLDSTGSQQTLEYLALNNLFITKLDGQGDWYRYHPLFAETLRYLLAKEGGQTIQNLHEKASQWYAQQTQSFEMAKAVKPVATLPKISSGRVLARETEQKTMPKFAAQPLAGLDNAPLFIEPLSERELEVLSLVLQGAANQEIAEKLTLSLNTIKKHTSNIFSKLGVPNRTQAVYRARRLGLVTE